MAVKPNNIVTFYSSQHNLYVKLVKKSIGKYEHRDVILSRVYPAEIHCMTYWTGQLVHEWTVRDPETLNVIRFWKGQKIWLDAAFFNPMN